MASLAILSTMEGEAGSRDRFAAWLRGRGEDAATVDGFLRIADRITSVAGGWDVRPKHVDEAMRRAEGEGAQATQLANLKRVGDALVEFARPVGVPMAPAGSAPVGGTNRCPVCSGPLALVQPAGGAASTLGGGLGVIGGIVGARLLGCFGMLAVLLAFGAVGAAYRGFTLRARCASCAFVASPEHLDRRLQDEIDGARRKALLGAVGMGIGAVVAFALWIGIAVALAPP